MAEDLCKIENRSVFLEGLNKNDAAGFILLEAGLNSRKGAEHVPT
jgi:hypothetical protein